MFWEINLKLDIYFWWVARRIEFEFRYNLLMLTYFAAKGKVKFIFYVSLAS